MFFSVFLGSCQVNNLGAEGVQGNRSHYSVRLAKLFLEFCACTTDDRSHMTVIQYSWQISECDTKCRRSLSALRNSNLTCSFLLIV